MVKNFTQDDVIRYSYNEMETTERLLFEAALTSDSELAELQESVEESKMDLDLAMRTPRKTVVDQVLQYSSHTARFEHTL